MSSLIGCLDFCPADYGDIECGACLRVLEGHEELVRCIRFDNKRIVSGAYDWVCILFLSHITYSFQLDVSLLLF